MRLVFLIFALKYIPCLKKKKKMGISIIDNEKHCKYC